MQKKALTLEKKAQKAPHLTKKRQAIEKKLYGAFKSTYSDPWAITFEPVDIETSFLVWWYILTISRSSLSIKVIGSRLRSHSGNANLDTWTSV